MLNQLNRTALKLRSSSIFIFFEVIFHFYFCWRSFFCFGRLPFVFGGLLSSWVKISLHTENQLPGLPGSACKVSVGWWGGGGGGGDGFHLIMWSHQLRIGLKLGCDNIAIC